MTRGNFLHGALILSMAGIISKAIGAVYRIPLARILGGEGMGLYQMAYPIYTSILALSTAGIPVAISILVAEKLAKADYSGAKMVFYVALGLLSLTGIACTYVLVVYANWLAEKILFEPRAFFPIVAIAPAIFFTAVVSAFRGFFQGHQEMLPTAVSQVVEQVVRVITVIIGALWLLPYGIEFAASGATFGAVTGGLSALLVLTWMFFRYPKQRAGKRGVFTAKNEPVSVLVYRIVKIALPLSVGGLVMPLMQVVDACIVPLRLQEAGMTSSRATELFGQLTGMAGSLINLPTIITISLAVSLVPAVSEAITKKQRWQAARRIQTGLRITMLVCLPAAVGLALLATPVSLLLYDVAEAGIPLAFLAPGILFLGLYQTTSGALQGLNKTAIPVINLFVGLFFKSILSFYLTAVPGVDIKGAAVATVSAFLLAFILNYFALGRIIGLRLGILENLVLPAIATGLMFVTVKHLYGLLFALASNGMATLGSILAGMTVYLFSLFMLGAVKKEDIAMLPVYGEKLASFLQGLHVLR